MLRRMSAVQWMEWKSYMLLAPFGEERMDARFAELMRQVVLGWVDREKHPNLTWQDFLMRFGDSIPEEERVKLEAKNARVDRKQTPEEIERLIAEWVLGANAALAEKERRGT